MRNIGLSDFLFFVSCSIVFIGAIVIPDSHLKKHVKPHQMRSTPQKCDLICPGQRPIPLPPNFMQNCTSSSTTNNTSSNPTTARPPRTTTTESGEDESTENNEEGSTNATARIGKHKQSLKRHHQSKSHHKTQKFRKETIYFRREAKSRLFKHHKYFKDKAQLDGCQVICSEPNAPGGKPPVNGGDQGDNGSDANDSNESDEGDNYVDGEDTPIEIIYVPPLEENRRPSDVYQINNYELIEPQPPFGFGFDPLFRAGKQKKVKNRKQHGRKNYHKNRSERKHPNRSP